MCPDGKDSVSVVGTALKRGPLFTFGVLLYFFLLCSKMIAIVTTIRAKHVGTPMIRGKEDPLVSVVIPMAGSEIIKIEKKLLIY